MNNPPGVYPVPIKSIMKATPSLIVYFIFSTLFCTCLYDNIYHAHDRIER